jgi:DNA-binding NarL/FixJ family response regulator
VRNTFPDLKIIALSSHPEAGQETLAAGADVFNSKVAPPDQLLDALRTINSNGDDFDF